MTASVSKAQHYEGENLYSKHLRYSVNPRNGIIWDMLENYRFLKFGDISDLKSKDSYASLFQFRQNTRQKFTVRPLSLEQYFQERQRNGTTADLMRYEWARYRTFSTFPTDSPARPIRLASNGFYYIGSGSTDNVKCFSCELVYQGWKEGDLVPDVHSKYSPNCPFLTGVDKSNVGIHSQETQTATGNGNKETTSCHHTGDVYVQKQCSQSSDNDASTPRRRQHKYPDFESYHYRMDTFTGWTCSEIIEPCVLADAGFFYAVKGFSDCVRCFSCGGGLRNWEYGDGPWEEHARWFPECLFLLQQKGQGFVRQHKEAQAESCSTDPGTSTAGKDLNAVQAGKLDPLYAMTQTNGGGNNMTVTANSNDEQNGMVAINRGELANRPL
ncbi:E3 ubiquitin-protein ligase XIAP-like [Mercenaria mercenaria]|uniref:E3 ubiquitin-protein ligase XIAP-like n=1 Tax=Mercenaria mercenaria TaxID=6596 RepID=UPI00234F8A24|nr:E3 ubiquitin-protein ligase XIAP-like [Mercenaria mercenaria]